MIKSNNSLLYFLASVGLVLITIVFTTIVDRTSSTQNGTDIRARAAASATLKFTATVSAVDSAQGTLTVDNLRFTNKTQGDIGKTLGTWKIIPPRGFILSSVKPGSKVTLSVNPKTFQITSHTLTSTAISVTR